MYAYILLMAATLPTPANSKAAADRALPLLVRGAEGHVGKQTCFACHNQTLPVLALRAAGGHNEVVRDQASFVRDFLKGNRDKFLKGVGTGGGVDTAGYALFTLELAGTKPDETTAAVAEYLLATDKDRDHWRARSNRPPSEASSFTTTHLALRGLKAFGTPEQKERIDRRVDQVRGWLLRTPARDTEDRVFRLLAMREVGIEPGVVSVAGRALMERQRPDGGWSQLDGRASDAYATGSALYALREAGVLKAGDAAYRNGVAFLLRTQLPDGSWRVKSRSSPFQPYYESGFPHGKDQFISITASGWAAAALRSE